MIANLPAGYDTTNYTRGWRASANANGVFVLDNADARNEPDAWYDGYYDYGAGRPKWHRPRCSAHHNGPGGCMLA